MAEMADTNGSEVPVPLDLAPENPPAQVPEIQWESAKPIRPGSLKKVGESPGLCWLLARGRGPINRQDTFGNPSFGGVRE